MAFDSADNVDDRELPDRSDMDGEDDDETSPCPHCKRRIYEQSEFCPYCGHYIDADESSNQAPIWVIVGVAIALLVVIFAWVL